MAKAFMEGIGGETAIGHEMGQRVLAWLGPGLEEAARRRTGDPFGSIQGGGSMRMRGGQTATLSPGISFDEWDVGGSGPMRPAAPVQDGFGDGGGVPNFDGLLTAQDELEARNAAIGVENERIKREQGKADADAKLAGLRRQRQDISKAAKANLPDAATLRRAKMRLRFEPTEDELQMEIAERAMDGQTEKRMWIDGEFRRKAERVEALKGVREIVGRAGQFDEGLKQSRAAEREMQRQRREMDAFPELPSAREVYEAKREEIASQRAAEIFKAQEAEKEKARKAFEDRREKKKAKREKYAPDKVFGDLETEINRIRGSVDKDLPKPPKDGEDPIPQSKFIQSRRTSNEAKLGKLERRKRILESIGSSGDDKVFRQASQWSDEDYAELEAEAQKLVQGRVVQSLDEAIALIVQRGGGKK